MKKTLLLILILLGLRQMAPAQGTIQFPVIPLAHPIPPIQFPINPLAPVQFGGNLDLNMNFSPLAGSPGTNQPSGTANYTYLYNLGNSFSISILLGNQSARLTDGFYKRTAMESYTPITEFTNVYHYYTFSPYLYPSNSFFPVLTPMVTNYYYTQTWGLMMDQAQALVAGKWYAEVSYGDDEYFGQLSPTYNQGPLPSITISPVSSFAAPTVTVFPGRQRQWCGRFSGAQ